MANQLKNIVRFTGLVLGVPVATAHNLNIDGTAILPDVVIPSLGGFTVTADDTNVTVTRTADSPGGDVDVLVIHWHSENRTFGPYNPPPGTPEFEGSLTPQPWILDPGTVSGAAVAGRYAVPEKWAQNNVAASQTDVDLTQLVSTLFVQTKMIRGGSITGLSTRFNEAITAGTATVTVTINGAAGTLAIVHTSGSNPSGGEATQGSGIDVFVAGDLVGVQITTDAGFLPITTDLESWVEIDT